VAKRGLGNFITDLRLIDSLAGNLEVDNGFSATTMANLILEFHGVDVNAAPQYTLPVVEDGQGYFYRGSGYGDVVFPVQPQDREVVAQFLGTASNEDAAGRALPSAGSFTVAIENGSGLYNQGSKTATALTQLGYDVTSVTDTTEEASTTETTVLYSRPDQLPDALRVQSALSGLAVIGYDPGLIRTVGGTGSSEEGGGGTSPTTSSSIDVGSPLPGSASADIVVVTGSNFAVNLAPNASPPTSAPGSSTTTTTVVAGQGGGSTTTTTVSGPLSDNPNLAPPSGSTEPLQPWDPRSCTASGDAGP
jgi:hypothetical protein